MWFNLFVETTSQSGLEWGVVSHQRWNKPGMKFSRFLPDFRCQWQNTWNQIKTLVLPIDIVNPYRLSNCLYSRYLAPVGSQNSQARVKWFSRYLALSREGHDSRIQDHRPTLPGVYNSQTVCWAIIEVLTFPGSLHTSTSHQRQITTSNIKF